MAYIVMAYMVMAPIVMAYAVHAGRCGACAAGHARRATYADWVVLLGAVHTSMRGLRSVARAV